MFRKLTMAGAIILTAACAYGQGEDIIGIPVEGNGGRAVTAARQGFASPGRSHYSRGGSAIDRLSRQNSYWIYSGRLPFRFEIVDLTDEQRGAMKDIMKEAKEARQKHQQEIYKAYRETKDRTVRQTQQKKMVEMIKTYRVRIEDVLTEEQKALLAKIDEITKKKREVDVKINEVMALARTQNADNAQEDLDKILTPEQRKKLEELMKPKPFVRTKGRGRLPARPAPAGRHQGGGQEGDPGEMF